MGTVDIYSTQKRIKVTGGQNRGRNEKQFFMTNEPCSGNKIDEPAGHQNCSYISHMKSNTAALLVTQMGKNFNLTYNHN